MTPLGAGSTDLISRQGRLGKIVFILQGDNLFLNVFSILFRKVPVPNKNFTSKEKTCNRQ